MSAAPVQPLAVAAMVCVIAFPVVQWWWRRTRRKRFTTGDFVKMAITGAGVPQAVCLVLWPVWPLLLTAATDLPLLLLPTGAISLYVSIGAIFDLD